MVLPVIQVPYSHTIFCRFLRWSWACCVLSRFCVDNPFFFASAAFRIRKLLAFHDRAHTLVGACQGGCRVSVFAFLSIFFCLSLPILGHLGDSCNVDPQFINNIGLLYIACVRESIFHSKYTGDHWLFVVEDRICAMRRHATMCSAWLPR